MLTRRKARILKREVDDIPLPRTSQRPRKNVKRVAPVVIVAMPLPVTHPIDNGPTAGERIDFIRPGECIIDTGINPDEQIQFHSGIMPAFTIPDSETNNVIPLPGTHHDNDNIPLVPLDEIDVNEKTIKPWARWQSFLRNGLITADSQGEPTDAQYEKAWTIWNHILQRTNVATKVSGPATGFTRANGPVITLLMRDHRGGEPNSVIMDSITDPDVVHIQAYKCRFGFLERDVTQYLQEETVEKALTRLRNIGWNDTPEEEKKHELYHCFY